METVEHIFDRVLEKYLGYPVFNIRNLFLKQYLNLIITTGSYRYEVFHGQYESVYRF